MRTGTILLAVGISLASAPPLFADILRGCEAIVVTRPYVGSGSMKLASIEGRGSCNNKARANDCRARARQRIETCLAGMWRDRHKNALAPECKTLASSGREGAKLSWDGIYRIAEPNRLSARMAYAACCRLKPDATRIQLELFAQIRGDKGCGGAQKAYPLYDMNCDNWRSRGLCN